MTIVFDDPEAVRNQGYDPDSWKGFSFYYDSIIEEGANYTLMQRNVKIFLDKLEQAKNYL